MKAYKKELKQDPLISELAFDLIKKLCTYDPSFKKNGKTCGRY